MTRQCAEHIKVAKPEEKDAITIADKMWGTLRDNPLNSQIATRLISAAIHEAATEKYGECCAIRDACEVQLKEVRAKLRAFTKGIKGTFDACPGCSVPSGKQHVDGCWVSVATGAKGWKSSKASDAS